MTAAELNRCRMMLNENPSLQADVLDVYHLGPAAIVDCLAKSGFHFSAAEYEEWKAALTPPMMTPFERMIAGVDDFDLPTESEASPPRK